jgi:hypothetical protein
MAIINLTMTPTDHEKREWARMAQAAYGSGHNSIGHRYSGAASLPNCGHIELTKFDSLQRDYRIWLIDNRFDE